MKEDTHPSEGDTLVLTGIVHNRAILGTGLPSGKKLANKDERFDEYTVEVVDIRQVTVGDRLTYEILTLETEDGETTSATYKGREEITGNAGQPIRASNSQGSSQGYIWEKQ